MSSHALYRQAREEGVKVTQKQVEKCLNSQQDQSRYRVVLQEFKRSQTFAPHMGYQLQVDLVDMSKYEKSNQNYRWILTGSDVFSRTFFALPLQRKHKDFVVNTFQLFLDLFEKRFGYLPTKVQFDHGGEFVNTRVLTLLDKLDIVHFST